MVELIAATFILCSLFLTVSSIYCMLEVAFGISEFDKDDNQ